MDAGRWKGAEALAKNSAKLVQVPTPKSLTHDNSVLNFNARSHTFKERKVTRPATYINSYRSTGPALLVSLRNDALGFSAHIVQGSSLP